MNYDTQYKTQYNVYLKTIRANQNEIGSWNRPGKYRIIIALRTNVVTAITSVCNIYNLIM